MMVLKQGASYNNMGFMTRVEAISVHTAKQSTNHQFWCVYSGFLANIVEMR